MSLVYMGTGYINVTTLKHTSTINKCSPMGPGNYPVPIYKYIDFYIYDNYTRPKKAANPPQKPNKKASPLSASSSPRNTTKRHLRAAQGFHIRLALRRGHRAGRQGRGNIRKPTHPAMGPLGSLNLLVGNQNAELGWFCVCVCFFFGEWVIFFWGGEGVVRLVAWYILGTILLGVFSFWKLQGP